MLLKSGSSVQRSQDWFPLRFDTSAHVTCSWYCVPHYFLTFPFSSITSFVLFIVVVCAYLSPRAIAYRRYYLSALLPYYSPLYG
ncbi:hypothetical protein K435DRAFT_309556 [Dendrothele bispora CBS 962.96]|uniref:Uncharacterized protein n=1 Tax=Dendrothele bispora (strain CBS 962.96) TaxID=1314807 RepID=A0A4S8MJP9_DENBC|nr:hypothetical protein K435DRAFT_309556 [Dendrothele bispora CBS 962.96]